MSMELHPSNCQWRHHACHGPWKLHGFINYAIHSYKLRRHLYHEHCVVYSNSNHFHHGNSFCSLWLPTYSSKQKCCLLRKSAFGALFKEVNHIAYQVRKCIKIMVIFQDETATQQQNLHSDHGCHSIVYRLLQCLDHTNATISMLKKLWKLANRSSDSLLHGFRLYWRINSGLHCRKNRPSGIC